MGPAAVPFFTALKVFFTGAIFKIVVAPILIDCRIGALRALRRR